jgi:hypothetical protein
VCPVCVMALMMMSLRRCLQEYYQLADSIALLPPVHPDAIDMVVSQRVRLGG